MSMLGFRRMLLCLYSSRIFRIADMDGDWRSAFNFYFGIIYNFCFWTHGIAGRPMGSERVSAIPAAGR